MLSTFSDTGVLSPAVTRVSPASGPRSGGTIVTITGTNLTGATAVGFGSTVASSFTVDSDTQITATAPAGTGTVDATVTTPSGTSSTGATDQYTYGDSDVPGVSSVSPSSGPTAGGTSVTITGSGLANATDVKFGANSATITSNTATQIIATAPAGAAGTVHVTVTVTTADGTSSAGASDQYTYVVANPPPTTTSKPAVVGSIASPSSSSAAGFYGAVNPGGLATTAHFDYGLDSRYTAAGDSGPVYDQSTADQDVGADFTSHSVTADAKGLVPNAVYHVRLVATNSAGTTFGPDATFTTPRAAPPAQPTLGKSFNVAPTGLVLILVHGKFVPLTQLSKIPNGTVINALHGTLTLTTAAAGDAQHATLAAKGKAKKPTKSKTQTGTFGGAVFKVTQSHSGLATLSLVEGAVKGAPSYASCKTKKGKAETAALSKKTLQLLHGSAHGKFRTKGRYSAATIRGTIWTVADRCDGTLTHAIKDTVTVNDFVRHKTIALHPGHSYLALAHPQR
jgi:hypothetical protein